MPKQSDTQRTILQGPLCSEETRQLAYEFVVRKATEGKLKPVGGVSGDLVAIYADILGLQEEHLATANEMVIVTSHGRKVIVKPKRIHGDAEAG